MEEPKINTEMLSALLKKRSFVQQVGEETGKKVEPGVLEVDRQIKQILQGKKATKSGEGD